MNKTTNDLMKIIILVFVLPVVILSLVIDLPRSSSAQMPSDTVHTSEGTRETAPTTQPVSLPQSTAPTLPSSVPTQAPTEPEPTEAVEQTVSVHMDGQLREMLLEEYLLGVVLAEMPASFHEEALKAQAVACRSYAWIGNSGRGNHKEGFVCTSAGCCQAYICPEQYIRNGGTWENVQKVSAAIDATKGEILTYEGQPVLATYFSCSGGKTESAITVFGVDYPYLQAVESPGEEFAGVYSYTVAYTLEEFARALSAELSGDPHKWIGEMTYTQGGGVNSVVIGNATYDGLTIKALLSLRSTRFTFCVTDTEIIVETQGYGHRVGMSQYGAQAMAVEGYSYHEILLHYYRGTSLAQSAVIP